MKRSSHTVAVFVLLCLAAPAFAAERPASTFDELVDCFRAVEEVRWRHRTWPESNPDPKPGLDDVLSEVDLRARVERTLRGVRALEQQWNRPITDAHLQAEMERMARETRQPERLAELWAALGDDPRRIAECLALPLIADRLLRSHYAFDPALHRDVRARAESALLSGDLDPAPFEQARYRRQTWVRTDSDSTGANLAGGTIHVSPKMWPERLARLGELAAADAADSLLVGRFGPLQETENTFYAVGVADRQEDRLTVVTVEWPKQPFERWRAESFPELLAEAPQYDTTFSLPTINTTSCAEDTWRPVRSLPDERDGHIAVWTGSELLVWGGMLFIETTKKPGGRYDPATDTWHPINSRNHPAGRLGTSAVWTGTEMIVWGGWGGSQTSNVFDTGGRYDPQADDWIPTTSLGAPAARTEPSAVWTGSEMIVWGGCTNGTCFGGLLGTGGRYDPSTDTWSATGTAGAPTARSNHTAIWSGNEMIVWGGDAGGATNTGGRYDPGANRWTATATTNAPVARDLHRAVWTGSLMIVWGGCEAGGCFTLEGTGGRYDPVTDTWQATSAGNAPDGRRFHTAVWTGSEMIVWGGCVDHDCTSHRATGGRYDPGTDTWTATATSGAPQARSRHTAVWSGSEMIVWAGCFGGECQIETNTGGRYDPLSDSWVPTSMETGPSDRLNHTAVWTGSEMIVWGGWDGLVQGNGKRYDPATDSWTALQGSGDPFARDKHTAVWTGSEMVVWGGSVQGIGAHNSGGRYDPVTDSWTATGTTGAPSDRMNHSAVWTGSEMIVWGGLLSSATGGRYSPATDIWIATSTTGAPRGRFLHSANWTGSEMIVWGGRSINGPEATGGRYDPGTGTWSTVGTSGAPAPRQSHVGVWSGTKMVVWGGRNDSVLFGDGGRYDPSTGAWSPTSATVAPDPRYSFTGIWTGDEMIVWGGYVDLSATDDHFTGGRYDPASDTWTATGTGAFTPFGRAVHTAVWTGNEMIVWGGWRTGNGSQTNTGAMYCGNGAAAGGIPGDVDGLHLSKNGGQLDLGWNPSCGDGASDYAVYEGTLGDWTTHMPVTCTTGAAISTPVTPKPDSMYYLVVPLNTTVEGSYGTNTEGFERSTSTEACMTMQDTATCP